MMRISVLAGLVLGGCIVRDLDAPPVQGKRGTISVSSRIACAIADETGAIECWGNSFTTPMRVGDFAGVESLALGGPQVGFAVLWDGSIAEIRTDFGGADPGPAVEGVYDLSVGRARACALVDDGGASCWETTERSVATVEGLSGALRVSVAPGSDDACAVMDDGTVRCWTWDDEGAADAQTVAGLADVVEIAQGIGHACARRADGTVRCWGANEHGELGDGTTTPSEVPVEVRGLAGVVQIAAGDMHTCARSEDGSVRCWGFAHYGQLGDGVMTPEPVTRPVGVEGLGAAFDVALGGHTSCARTDDGVFCWGDNLHGQLGNGTSTASATPEPVEL